MANRKFAKIVDSFGLGATIETINKKIRDDVSSIIHDSASNSKVGLLTEAQVTHAGIVNANYGYYKPEKLEASISTWLEPYAKPVLAHHDMTKDNIGRVAGSRYKANIPTIVPKVKNSIYETDYSYRGLGHIDNLMNITDEKAALKVLDGTYLTMSVHGDNDEMTCSICNQEWINDGKCYHRFGDTYESEKTGESELCFWKAGNFIWSEVSFVNEPADPFAQIITRELVGDAKDQILQVYQYKDVSKLGQPIADSLNRGIKFWAINDSKNMKLALNDETSIDSLYKLYDVRHTPVGIDLKSKEMESNKVADNITTEQVATEAAKVAQAKIEDATNKEVATIVTDVKTESVAEVKTETAAAIEDEVTATVEDQAKILDEKVKLATTDAIKPLNDTIKTLESTVTDLTDEKKTLTDQAVTLQASIRDMKLEQVLDLKETLGVDSYMTIEDRTKAKQVLAERTEDSINDTIKDLKDTLKKTKRPVPANITIGDAGTETPSIKDQTIKILSEMDPVKLLALKMSGKLNLPIKQ